MERTQLAPVIKSFRRFSTSDWIIASTALFIICLEATALLDIYGRVVDLPAA